MQYWILKTEPTTYSIDDLKAEKETSWEGVRNYQARNFLVSMKKGDKVLVYHSGTDPVGIAGLGKIGKEAEPDQTQYDPKSDYFDPKSTPENPRWFAPRVAFVRKFRDVVTLADLRHEKSLGNLILLKKGNRLSVMPVDEQDYSTILGLGKR